MSRHPRILALLAGGPPQGCNQQGSKQVKALYVSLSLLSLISMPSVSLLETRLGVQLMRSRLLGITKNAVQGESGSIGGNQSGIVERCRFALMRQPEFCMVWRKGNVVEGLFVGFVEGLLLVARGRDVSMRVFLGSDGSVQGPTRQVARIGAWRGLHRRMSAVLLSLLAVGAAAAWTRSSVALANLPDGRVYEQVSPSDKNGNYVYGTLFGLASEEGDSVLFMGSGAMGLSYSSMINEFVARRSPSGWATTSAIPREQGNINVFGGPLTVVPSQDFSRFLFTAFSPYVTAEPLGQGASVNIFLSEDSSREPAWLGDPAISDPIPAPGNNQSTADYLVVGGTPDLSTVYFTYSGTLIPQDASRAAYVGDGMGHLETDPWGFYEWTAEKLAPAGVLPDGTLNPFGAVPAAIAGSSNFERVIGYSSDQAQALDNEVSADGSRAFFISPDPVASTVTDPTGCKTSGDCTSAPPELYVRETQPDDSTRTVLVSRSELPGHEGESAPSGVVKVWNAPVNNGEHVGATYVYASTDGSQAFFESTDQLTDDAPNDGSAKKYDFDVQSGAVTYLPGVVGPVVATAPDGSDLIFENTSTTPAELDLWTAGANGGGVQRITSLPAPANAGEPFSGGLDVSAGRSSADGSVFVFRTNAPVPGGFNNEGGYAQVYRYQMSTHELACVSCPPTGVAPSGNANVSYDNTEAGVKANGSNSTPKTTVDTRVMSADGGRVFFDTPDPLVPSATNGKRDVYEWENGSIYLISSGTSSEESDILDSSATGADVFFVTAAGLVAGDKDDSYDVYDARIPRPGDNPPPSVVPCQGDVCQGPPSVPALLETPASAAFNGAGNIVEPRAPAKVTTKVLTRAQKLASALRACRKDKSKHKRNTCEKQAHRKYGTSAAATKHETGRSK